jgi:methylenetetrahydrofolate dehydrogenase (NADP+)/methenyltetrahydrofolate cyclohydrolase
MTIIDGKAEAAALRTRVGLAVAARRQRNLPPPALAVVLVGDDPASHVYVRNKIAACAEVGIRSIEHRLAADSSEAALLALVAALNADPEVSGILVQLPLPPGLDARKLIAAIDPDKDVDGFHPMNAGRLATGLPGFVPCTPLGCMRLLETTVGDVSGANALVVGRSNIVGRPMAALLLGASATVTVAHSKSRDLAGLVAAAEIVVAAIGRPQAIRGAWIRPGAAVIDVGINRITGADGRSRLVGDVEFETAAARAGHITPVPGGVGPMTIACLLENTLKAAGG